MFPLHVLKDELRQRNKVMQSYFLDFGLRISVSNVGVCPIMLANTRKMCTQTSTSTKRCSGKNHGRAIRVHCQVLVGGKKKHKNVYQAKKMKDKLSSTFCLWLFVK